MEQRLDPQVRCAAMVATLNAELSWHLDEARQQLYSEALPRYLPNPCVDLQLRHIIINYHLDHEQIEALVDQGHPRHMLVWESWMPQVVRVLRHAGMVYTNDHSFDLEDLAQVARADLAQALPSFRYASRFSTWVHQVVIHSARRVIRDSQAQKRAGRPDSLEQSSAFLVPAPSDDHPETVAAARSLSALIQDILENQPDPRFPHIFHLWAEKDLSIVEVGKHVHLSQARVRVLIQHICQVLQQHPAIRSWLDENESTDK